METRTYWLSFADAEDGFRGAVLVDVTRAQADAALAARPDMADKAAGPWILAATQACWAAGVNPGGQVAAWDVTAAPSAAVARFAKLRLYSRAEIEAVERVM